MLKWRSRFSLLGQTPGERPAIRAPRICHARRETRESSCSRRWKPGPGCPINRELSRPIEHAVDLTRHDEIVLVQSLDLLGAERDRRVTPAEADIGVMTFGLGELADPLHEGERLPEIAESKRAFDAAGIIAQFPIRRLLLETQRFIARKRRNAAATRRAGFFREGFGHRAAPVSTSWRPSGQRSISPNTMSSEPMIAATSASICPRLRKSIACRWANDGARILHL